MKGLKITLWICAIHFLLSFIFLPLPWSAITAWFNQYGVQITAEDPWTIFWFRLLLATFGMIGAFFVILARNPLKYGEMLLLAACGLLLFAVVVLIGSIHYVIPNELPIITIASIGKVFFYFILAVLILSLRKEAIQVNNEKIGINNAEAGEGIGTGL